MTSRLLKAALIAAVLIVSRTAFAQDRITPPSVPAEIELSGAYKVFFFGHAVGTQNYMCAPAAGTASGLDWFFLGPQATLFDSSGEQVVTHFLSRNPSQNEALQATWQHSRDSSRVWARRLQGSVDAAYVAPDAIEWLLLEVTGRQAGPTGGDKFGATVRIHRVNTVGGVKPPSDECTVATINARRFVRYEADYYFYK